MNNWTQDNPLQQWGQRVTQAYLGLDRAASGYTSFLKNISTQQNIPSQFLTDASVLGLYCQCGKEADKIGGISQTVSRQRAACSVRLSGQLGQILYGPFQDILSEWCSLAIGHKAAIPLEMAAELLDIAIEKKEQKSLILSALGQEARWLAEQNPRWRSLLETMQQDASVWQTGLRQQRIEYLAALRQQDSARARELLCSTWAQENGEDRVEFLKILLCGLSIEDEPFLEKTLDDKRKGIREIAADFLSRIPGSMYGKRMAERVFSVIQFTPASRFVIKLGKGKFEVSIPDNPDKSWLRDIIETKASSGVGIKAVMLRQIIAGVNLSEWNRWQASASDLIDAAMAGDWAGAMLGGWFTAACQQKNSEWIRLFLLKMDVIQKKLPSLNYAWLVQSLEDKDREPVLTEVLGRQGGPASLWLLELLTQYGTAWSQSFSEVVLKAAKSCAAGINEYQLRHLMEMSVKHFALCMAPQVLPIVETGWPEKSPAWTKSVQSNLEKWISILQFRKEIIEEFKS